MRACLTARDIEALVNAKASDRRALAAKRHILKCKRCAEAVEQASANEAWLKKMLEDEELPEVRRTIADATSGGTQPAGTLTGGDPAS